MNGNGIPGSYPGTCIHPMSHLRRRPPTGNTCQPPPTGQIPQKTGGMTGQIHGKMTWFTSWTQRPEYQTLLDAFGGPISCGIRVPWVEMNGRPVFRSPLLSAREVLPSAELVEGGYAGGCGRSSAFLGSQKRTLLHSSISHTLIIIKSDRCIRP